MRLAFEAQRVHRAGGEVIAVSVDDAERQAAMFARWPTPHIWYQSDPAGDTYLRPLDLFDPVERDGIAVPASLVLDPDGNEVYRDRGRDFADRTRQDETLRALEALGLGAIDPPAGGPVADVATDQRGAFQPRMMSPYFRGNRSAALAIGGRADGDEAKALAREHRHMCDDTLAAWDALKRS
ncbi:MAG: hypothetical protein HKN44_00660 [Ilumatobacter sp.]|nr:hypothetical protein [Ilumatobacter sp.]